MSATLSPDAMVWLRRFAREIACEALDSRLHAAPNARARDAVAHARIIDDIAEAVARACLDVMQDGYSDEHGATLSRAAAAVLKRAQQRGDLVVT